MASKTEKAQIDLIINGAVANKSIRDLEASARSLKSTMRGMTDPKDIEASGKKLDVINKKLDEMKVKGNLAKSSWDKMKESVKTTFIGNVGANMATMGIQKVASYFTDAFNAAVKLSDQMADVRKTTGMTVTEVANLRKELSGIDTRTSMSDLMEIAKVGGQFGVAKDQLLGFVKAVDMTTVALGDEFTGGAEQVATEMAKLRNIFKDIQTDDIGTDVNFIANAINELAAAGVATGPVVADLANRIGGYGIQVGLTSGQTLGLSATLQELGVSSERGGTAVVKILQKMLTNTSEFAKIAGMELGQFKELLNKDIYGAFVKVMEGSKQLGPNAGMLAKIIQDLEVQGAGASEVFAKLGSNTEMLAEKTKLASDALTNTSSISEEFRLKNENLAGSVEALGKEWNKLLANPAMIKVFEVGISLTRQMVGGIEQLIDSLKVGFAYFTEGAAGAMQEQAKQAAKIAAESAANTLAIEKKVNAEHLAAYKQKLAGMSSAALAHEAIKIQYQQKAQADELKRLQAAGNEEQFYIELKWAKQLQAQSNAIEKAQNAKINATKKGNEELSKEEISAAKKRSTEAEKHAKELLKIEEKRLADTLKSMDEDEKRMKEYGKKIGKEVQDYIQAGRVAAADLKRLNATNDAEEEAAIRAQYALKMEIHQEGSFQYKLLHQQMLNEISAAKKKNTTDDLKTDKDKLQEQLANLREYSEIATSTLSFLNQRQNQLSQNKLTAQRAVDQKERENLKQQLDTKIISQEQYDAKIKEIDAAANERERKERQSQAEAEKGTALFIATIKAALAWIEFALNPLKGPGGAILATAQAAIIASTPVPQYYSGGWMPGSNNDRDSFPIIAHANEYMVDAKSARDPYVMNTVDLIEQAKKTGVSPSQLAAQSTATIEKHTTTVQSIHDAELKELLSRLTLVLETGIHADLIASEEVIRTLETETQKRLGTFRSKNGKNVADKPQYLFNNNWL